VYYTFITPAQLLLLTAVSVAHGLFLQVHLGLNLKFGAVEEAEAVHVVVNSLFKQEHRDHIQENILE
jgi:hypothetical protein